MEKVASDSFPASALDMRIHVDRFDVAHAPAPPVSLLMSLPWDVLNARLAPSLSGTGPVPIRRITLRRIDAVDPRSGAATALVSEPIRLFDAAQLKPEDTEAFGIVARAQDTAKARTHLVLVLAGHAAFHQPFYSDPDRERVRAAHLRALFGTEEDMTRRLSSRVFWHDRLAAALIPLLDAPEGVFVPRSVLGVGYDSNKRGMRRYSDRDARLPMADYAVCHNVGVRPVLGTNSKKIYVDAFKPLASGLVNEHLCPFLMTPYATWRPGATAPAIQSPFALETLPPGADGNSEELTYQWPLMQRVQALVRSFYPSTGEFVDLDLLTRAYEIAIQTEVAARAPLWTVHLDFDVAPANLPEGPEVATVALSFTRDVRVESLLHAYTGEEGLAQFVRAHTQNPQTALGRIQYASDVTIVSRDKKNPRTKSVAAKIAGFYFGNKRVTALRDHMTHDSRYAYDAFNMTIEGGMPQIYMEAMEKLYLLGGPPAFAPHIEALIAARLRDPNARPDESLELMLRDALNNVAPPPAETAPVPIAGTRARVAKKRAASRSPDRPSASSGALSSPSRATKRARTQLSRSADGVRGPSQSARSDTAVNMEEADWAAALNTAQAFDDARMHGLVLPDDFSYGGAPVLRSDLARSISSVEPGSPKMFDNLFDGASDGSNAPPFKALALESRPFAVHSSSGSGGDDDDDDRANGGADKEHYLAPLVGAALDAQPFVYRAEESRSMALMLTLFANQARWDVGARGQAFTVLGPFHYLTTNATAARYRATWLAEALDSVSQPYMDWEHFTVEFVVAPSLRASRDTWFVVKNVSPVAAIRRAHAPFSATVALPAGTTTVAAVFVNVRDARSRQTLLQGPGLPVFNPDGVRVAYTHLRLARQIASAALAARAAPPAEQVRWHAVQPLWFGERLPVLVWTIGARDTVVLARADAIDKRSAVVRNGVTAAACLLVSTRLLHAVIAMLADRVLPLTTIDMYGDLALTAYDEHGTGATLPHADGLGAALEALPPPPLIVCNLITNAQEPRARSRKIPDTLLQQ